MKWKIHRQICKDPSSDEEIYSKEYEIALDQSIVNNYLCMWNNGEGNIYTSKRKISHSEVK